MPEPTSHTAQAALLEAEPSGGGWIATFQENLGALADLHRTRSPGRDGDTEEVVWASVEALILVTGADGCSVTLAEGNVEMLVSRNGAGTDRHTHFRDTMAARGTLGHAAIREREPRTVIRWRGDLFHHYPEAVHRGGFESIACFPVEARGRSLGVLTFYYRSPRDFTRTDSDLGRVLAQTVAFAVDNSLLLAEGRQNILNTVQALVRSLEAKDSQTSYHSLRVTQYATLIAEQMGLDEGMIRTVQYGAMLHDIGKIGIVGQILNKKGKLTEEEWAVVRTHPLIGARIVETVDYLAGAVPVVRHHHEYFDGSGYPDGLCGKEIPLGARIVSVPDYYDALTSDRPYRAALPHDEAIDGIRGRTGKIFDPEIAEIFLAVHGGVPSR